MKVLKKVFLQRKHFHRPMLQHSYASLGSFRLLLLNHAMDIALTMPKFLLKMGVLPLEEMISIFFLVMGIASRILQNPLQFSLRQNENQNII